MIFLRKIKNLTKLQYKIVISDLLLSKPKDYIQILIQNVGMLIRFKNFGLSLQKLFLVLPSKSNCIQFNILDQIQIIYNHFTFITTSFIDSAM